MLFRSEAFFQSLLSTNRQDGFHGNPNPKYNYFYSFIERHATESRALSNSTTTVGFGFDFGIVSLKVQSNGWSGGVEQVYAVVTYVIDGTPAAAAGLQRGDYIGAINGVRLTEGNYKSYYPLLMSEDATGKQPSKVTLARYTIQEQTSGYPLEVEVDKPEMEPAVVTKDPCLMAKVLTTGSGKKVGYFVYNQFDYGTYSGHEFDDVMKRSLAELKNGGITELVLDLRYNGGGYVTSNQLLSSIIAPAANAEQMFQRAEYNDHISSTIYQNGNESYKFLTEEQMQGYKFGQNEPGVMLDLPRLYVLVSGATASASEALIFCLRSAPAPVTVHVIGERTEGKTVGMTRLNAQSGHGGIFDGYQYDIWPVTFYICNSQGERASYTNGIVPDFELEEFSFKELIALGDLEEPLLKSALTHIETGGYPHVSASFSRSAGAAWGHEVLLGSSSEHNPLNGSRVTDIPAE